MINLVTVLELVILEREGNVMRTIYLPCTTILLIDIFHYKIIKSSN